MKSEEEVKSSDCSAFSFAFLSLRPSSWSKSSSFVGGQQLQTAQKVRMKRSALFSFG